MVSTRVLIRVRLIKCLKQNGVKKQAATKQVALPKLNFSKYPFRIWPTQYEMIRSDKFTSYRLFDHHLKLCLNLSRTVIMNGPPFMEHTI